MNVWWMRDAESADGAELERLTSVVVCCLFKSLDPEGGFAPVVDSYISRSQKVGDSGAVTGAEAAAD